jgi:hypothetical protein
VHYVLAAISLTLAAGTAWIGYRAFRPGSSPRAQDPSELAAENGV